MVVMKLNALGVCKNCG